MLRSTHAKTSVDFRLPHHSAPNTTDRTNVTLHDTNYALQYLPETNRWGIKVRNVWKKYYYLPFLKPDDTFHYTTNYGNEVSGFENRQISFEFKGRPIFCIRVETSSSLRSLQVSPSISTVHLKTNWNFLSAAITLTATLKSASTHHASRSITIRLI